MIKQPKTPPTDDPFVKICRKEFDSAAVRELRFHPTRKWRFDYALPTYKVAIEIDGGAWHYGRHNRASGFLADMQKLNAAAALGWRVLRFTPQMQYTQSTLDTIRQTINQV